MLEVCFSDSVKGALKVAQHCEGMISGATSIGVISDKKRLFSFWAKRKALKEYKKRQKELQRQAVSLGGNREDIVGISFGLSEGNIQTPICFKSCPRKDYFYSLFSFNRYNEQENVEDSINEFWSGCIKDLEKLNSNPEKIRVWSDNTPDSQCGLLFVADLLRDSKTEIHIVTLPSKIKRADNSIIEYRAWGEVAPQSFGTFLEGERALTELEIKDLSNQWQLLKNENAPLRVVENGVVVSADESYYDDLIRQEFPNDTCKIGHIIENALGKQKILTGDVFIAKRIQHFIDMGELVVFGKTNDEFYSTIVHCHK